MSENLKPKLESEKAVFALIKRLFTLQLSEGFSSPIITGSELPGSSVNRFLTDNVFSDAL